MKKYLKDTTKELADYVLEIRGEGYTFDMFDLTLKEFECIKEIWDSGMNLDDGPLMQFSDFCEFQEFINAIINDEIESR